MLSGNRFRLGIGTGWNTVEYEALDEDSRTGAGARPSRWRCSAGCGPRTASTSTASSTRSPGQHPTPPDRTDPDLVRRLGAGRAAALRRARRRLDPPRHAERGVGRAAGDDPGPPGGGRALDGRLRRPGPGPVPRRRPGPLADPRRALARPRRHPPGDRHPQRRRHRRRRPPRPRRRVPGRRQPGRAFPDTHDACADGHRAVAHRVRRARRRGRA